MTGGWAGVDWLTADSCETAGQFGFLVGVAAGVLADVLIIGLIVISRKLGTGRCPPTPTWSRASTWLQRGTFCVPAIWILAWPALQYWGDGRNGAYLSCYVTSLAYSAAATIGVVVAVVMLAAANQIGARSVR